MPSWVQTGSGLLTKAPIGEIELGHDYTKTDSGLHVPQHWMDGADPVLLESFFTHDGSGTVMKAPEPKLYKPSIWAKPATRDPVASMTDLLPDIYTEVECPSCNLKDDLYSLIQHVNDHHAWTREKIADWIENLPLDLTFKAASIGN